MLNLGSNKLSFICLGQIYTSLQISQMLTYSNFRQNNGIGSCTMLFITHSTLATHQYYHSVSLHIVVSDQGPTAST